MSLSPASMKMIRSKMPGGIINHVTIKGFVKILLGNITILFFNNSVFGYNAPINILPKRGGGIQWGLDSRIIPTPRN